MSNTEHTRALGLAYYASAGTAADRLVSMIPIGEEQPVLFPHLYGPGGPGTARAISGRHRLMSWVQEERDTAALMDGSQEAHERQEVELHAPRPIPTWQAPEPRHAAPTAIPEGFELIGGVWRRPKRASRSRLAMLQAS